MSGHHLSDSITVRYLAINCGPNTVRYLAISCLVSLLSNIWLSAVCSQDCQISGQSAHPMSSSEAKTILGNNFRMEWQQRLDIGTEEDSIHQLDRAAEFTIFILRTGHCQLLSYLHSLKISHSDECPCRTGPQTPNHILQSCPTFDTLRCQTWPSPVEASQEVLGTS